MPSTRKHGRIAQQTLTVWNRGSVWLCWQSGANQSQPFLLQLQGKYREISIFTEVCPTIRLDSHSNFRALQGISLNSITGNSVLQNRVFIRSIRELICRHQERRPTPIYGRSWNTNQSYLSHYCLQPHGFFQQSEATWHTRAADNKSEYRLGHLSALQTSQKE